MTIQRTRELLGNEVKDLTDEQVQEYISQTRLVVEALLENIINHQLHKLPRHDYNG